LNPQSSALPAQFLSRMEERLGNELQEFIAAHEEETPSSILLNPLKKADISLKEGSSIVPWNQYGKQLRERPKFIRDPLYHAGTYYSQEASSMVIAQVLDQYPVPDNALALDLCAAPGGKSLVLLNALPEDAFLISNEIHKGRASILDENLLKWGHTNHLITQTDAKVLSDLTESFDLILVDAPCSGEGMFRKDAGAIQEWSPGHVKACAVRQQGILEDILPALKQGGILIYSTCTYAPEENQGIETFLLGHGMSPLLLNMDPAWGFESASEHGHAHQAMIHKVKGEGFYFAAYHKDCAHPSERLRSVTLAKGSFESSLLTLPDNFKGIQFKGEEYAMDAEREELICTLDALRCMKRPGIPLGQWKGKDFIPANGLALIPDWPKAERTEMTLEEAWAYLRRETPPIQGPDRGWTLASFQGYPLGWIKWVNGRMKNHYTKEWRIRSQW